VNVVSIRDLSRNPSAVVDEVERSGRPALVTRNGKPIAALVRIDQDRLEDWLQSTVGDPPIGESLEETPEALRASARPVSTGKRRSGKKTSSKDAAFLAALAE
jgi:prevent-host-death family protein